MTSAESPSSSDVLDGIPDDYDPAALAEKKAKELSNPALFKFMSFLQDGGKSLPTEEVTVFTALGTQLEIQTSVIRKGQLLAEAKQAASDAYNLDVKEWSHQALGTVGDLPAPDAADEKYLAATYLTQEYHDLDPKIAELQSRLYDSRIVFTIKGIAPRIMQVIDSNLTRYRSKLVAAETETSLLNEMFDMRRLVLLTSAAVVKFEAPAW